MQINDNNNRQYRMYIKGLGNLKLLNLANLYGKITCQVSLLANSGTANIVKWVQNVNGTDLDLTFYTTLSTDPTNEIDYDGVVEAWINLCDTDINSLNLVSGGTNADIINF